MPNKVEIEITDSGKSHRSSPEVRKKAARNKRARRKRRVRSRRKNFKADRVVNRADKDTQRRNKAERLERERRAREARRRQIESRQASRDFINDFFGSIGHSRTGYRINRGIDLATSVLGGMGTGESAQILAVLRAILNVLMGKVTLESGKTAANTAKSMWGETRYTHGKTTTNKSTYTPRSTTAEAQKETADSFFDQKEFARDIAKHYLRLYHVVPSRANHWQRMKRNEKGQWTRNTGMIPHPTANDKIHPFTMPTSPSTTVINAPWWNKKSGGGVAPYKWTSSPYGFNGGFGGAAGSGGWGKPPKIGGPTGGGSWSPGPTMPWFQDWMLKGKVLTTGLGLLSAAVLESRNHFNRLNEQLGDLPGELMFAKLNNELLMFQANLQRAGKFGAQLAEIESIKGEGQRAMMRAIDKMAEGFLPLNKAFEQLVTQLAKFMEDIAPLISSVGDLASEIGQPILGFLNVIVGMLGDLLSGNWLNLLFHNYFSEKPTSGFNSIEQSYRLLNNPAMLGGDDYLPFDVTPAPRFAEPLTQMIFSDFVAETGARQ